MAILCALVLLGGGILANHPSRGWQQFEQWAVWISTYLLVLAFSFFAKWQSADLGLAFTPWLAVVSTALLLLLSVYLGTDLPPVYNWWPWVTEAFARTSEELFFRGFLFALLLHKLDGRHGARFWALLLTALLFTLVHAPLYGASGQTNLPLVFLLGLVLGLLRLLSSSVLPGIMVHGILNAGIPGMVLGTGLYFVMVAAVFLIEQRK